MQESETNTLANLARKAEKQDKKLKVKRRPLGKGFVTEAKLQ